MLVFYKGKVLQTSVTCSRPRATGLIIHCSIWGEQPEPCLSSGSAPLRCSGNTGVQGKEIVLGAARNNIFIGLAQRKTHVWVQVSGSFSPGSKLTCIPLSGSQLSLISRAAPEGLDMEMAKLCSAHMLASNDGAGI